MQGSVELSRLAVVMQEQKLCYTTWTNIQCEWRTYCIMWNVQQCYLRLQQTIH